MLICADATQRNVMSAAWKMALDFDPPKIAVVIDKQTWSRPIIEASGEFAINVRSTKLAQASVDGGHCSDAPLDKFERFQLQTFEAILIQAPLLHHCVA